LQLCVVSQYPSCRYLAARAELPGARRLDVAGMEPRTAAASVAPASLAGHVAGSGSSGVPLRSGAALSGGSTVDASSTVQEGGRAASSSEAAVEAAILERVTGVLSGGTAQ
jgi:hypothetical protein